MATFKRFEDIIAWQKARELANTIYKASLKGEFAKNFDLRNQINRSAGSVMDNIAEGYGRSGKNEFVNFLAISKGSLEELKSQLYRCLDRNYVNSEEFDRLYSAAEEIKKSLISLMIYINGSELNGTKFKNRV